MFEEHVHSKLGACCAVGCMMIGLLGMAYYSAPDVIEEELEEERQEFRGQYECPGSITAENGQPTEDEYSETSLEEHHDEELIPGGEVVNTDGILHEYVTPQSHVICFGTKWSRRALGIVSAMFAGIYGGSVMVPMKWAPADARGMSYLISFAIGAATVNLSLWIFRGIYLSYKNRSFSVGYNALPSLHLKKMWRYGGACGLLWSIGNIFSIISVEYLGQGVGYSVVQSSILGTCHFAPQVCFQRKRMISLPTVQFTSERALGNILLPRGRRDQNNY